MDKINRWKVTLFMETEESMNERDVIRRIGDGLYVDTDTVTVTLDE